MKCPRKRGGSDGRGDLPPVVDGDTENPERCGAWVHHGIPSRTARTRHPDSHRRPQEPALLALAATPVSCSSSTDTEIPGTTQAPASSESTPSPKNRKQLYLLPPSPPPRLSNPETSAPNRASVDRGEGAEPFARHNTLTAPQPSEPTGGVARGTAPYVSHPTRPTGKT